MAERKVVLAVERELRVRPFWAAMAQTWAVTPRAEGRPQPSASR